MYNFLFSYSAETLNLVSLPQILKAESFLSLEQAINF